MAGGVGVGAVVVGGAAEVGSSDLGCVVTPAGPTMFLSCHTFIGEEGRVLSLLQHLVL